jgi:geranylgeranyl diphosphate synthase type II
MQSLETYLRAQQQCLEAALDRYLPAPDAHPPALSEAMRYSVFAGGKRLRPILLLAATDAVGGDRETVLPAACALEFVHTYSLIHDDLPAMDDDDYRRGRLTSHRVFGEAVAILAGDALLTYAFEVMINPALMARFAPAVLLEATHCLARAAGCAGMVGGQVVDMISEGRKVSLDVLEYIHRHKTAALIGASVTIGGLLGSGSAAQMEALKRYGQAIGLAFQIADDVLDVEGDSTAMGKQVGQDAQHGKATYPALLSVEASRQQATALLNEALAALDDFDDGAERLRQLARFIVNRKV